MKKRNIPIFITIGILILCVTFIVVLICALIYATVFWEHPHYGIFYIGNYYEGIGMAVDIDEENERVIVVTKNNDEYPTYYFEFSIIFNDDYKFYDEYVKEYVDNYWNYDFDDSCNWKNFNRKMRKEYEYTDELGNVIELDDDGLYSYTGDKTFYISYKNANEKLKSAINFAIQEKDIQVTACYYCFQYQNETEVDT